MVFLISVQLKRCLPVHFEEVPGLANEKRLASLKEAILIQTMALFLQKCDNFFEEYPVNEDNT